MTIGLLSLSAIVWGEYVERQRDRINYERYYNLRYSTRYHTTRPTTPDPGKVVSY